MKNIKLYIGAIILLGILVFYLIPNILTPTENRTYEAGTLRKVYVEKYDYRPPRSFNTYERERLVLITIDREERKYKLTDAFKEYWDIFLDPESINKYLRVRLDSRDIRENPIEIELGDAIIYSKYGWAKSNWLMFILPIAVIIIFVVNKKK